MPQMRRSRVLEKLRAGKVASSFKLNFSDGRVAEIAAMLGFDCIWVCMEHVGTGWDVVEKQIWAAKCHDTDIMVRVARGSYSDYIRPLELDAAGIMVPHLMSLEDAKHVVRTTRFHPVGRRPLDSGNADGSYAMLSYDDYLKSANDQRFVVVQIEDPEPMDELDEIAAVDGIDMLFFGPGDFSHGIGAPGKWDDPRISEARRTVVETALRHGKFAGTVGSADNLAELVDMGYRFINIGADVLALAEYCERIVRAFESV